MLWFWFFVIGFFLSKTRIPGVLRIELWMDEYCVEITWLTCCPWELLKDEVSCFPILSRKFLSWNILSIVLSKSSPTVVDWPDLPAFLSILLLLLCFNFLGKLMDWIGFSRVLYTFLSNFKVFFANNIHPITGKSSNKNVLCTFIQENCSKLGTDKQMNLPTIILLLFGENRIVFWEKYCTYCNLSL